MSFLTTYWFVSCPTTTTYLCWLCHSPLPDKENCFVCLFIVAFLSTIVWVFFLAILHGMHLVIPTHHSLFWVVCQTFPPKEFEQELHNRLSLLPIARPYPLLPLTHDPPLLYWLGTSWWCLGLMCAPLSCMSKACLLLMRLPWAGRLFARSAAHSWPFVAWTILWSSILHGCFLQGLGLAWLWAFLPFSPLFVPSVGLAVFLPCHSVILAVALFDLCLLGLFQAYCILLSQLVTMT